MKKQKIMSQMKGQDKTPDKQLNEVETGKLPEKEFRIVIVKVIQDLGKTMQASNVYQQPRRTIEQTNREE